ncbi:MULTISPECIES: hypothetical protein [unclassified Fibrobacter]|uniref:hypothetical protein n=1 Tax=unclassified Fibrobacter TaxID=2634177 RepID=UPI000D6B5922|nr:MULTISPECIES: hypothetical protein [unclassified Fibrobacter]
MFNLGESQQKRVAKPPTHVDEEPIFSENYENLVSKGVVKKREFSLDIGLDSFDLVFNAKKCF